MANEHQYIALSATGDHCEGDKLHEDEPESFQPRTLLEPTQEWANGLRGLVASLVLFHHLVIAFDLRATLTATQQDLTLRPWQWPIIRAVIGPNFLVSIFFVLSGYVLSYRPLYKLQTQHHTPEEIRDSLSSACFRRFFRLFPPAVLSILFSHTLLLTGAYQVSASALVKTDGWWVKVCTPHYIHPTWFSQTLEAFKNMVVIWIQPKSQPATPSSYNVALWTIPEEMRGSLNVFMFLMATSRLQRRYRIMSAAALFFGHILAKQIIFMNFLFGTLLADIHIMQLQSDSRPRLKARPMVKIFQIATKLLFFLIALFFGSYPPQEAERAAWSNRLFGWLRFYSTSSTQVGEVYIFMGTALFVLTITQSPTAQRYLSIAPLRFIGWLSYSMYLFHIPMLLSLGMTLVYHFRAWGMSELWSVLVMAPFWIGATLGLSYFSTRYVDEKAIYLSHKVERVLERSRQ